MVARKQDSEQIKQVLADLLQASWLQRSERRLWPRFIFHYTALPNAISILQDGFIYARSYVEESNKLLVSSGSNEVLSNTDAFIKSCVRFYFRPKTPTQFWAEGIRSSSSLQRSSYPDAHCPIPVFFLFDSVDILTRADCQFFDANLAGTSNHQLFSSVVELANLPWQKIYHNSWIDRNRPEESDIGRRRCAEVIIPHRIDLGGLRYICCRSEAEKETLLNLLPHELQTKYRRQITATKRIDLFERKHTYIETVRLTSTSMHFQFSPETLSPGPFHLQQEIEDLDRKIAYEDQRFDLSQISNYIYGGTLRKPRSEYTVTLTLDGHPAYKGLYWDFEDIPF
jgi:hypothetical protein